MNDPVDPDQISVVVIGGRGFYGTRVVRALRARGYDVSVAGRPPVDSEKTVAIDLQKPATFDALEPFDVVVSIANSVAAPGDALVSWVDRSGATLVEASAFAPFYRRTLARPRRGNGTILLGAGVFPGFSTGLACRTADELEIVERVELAVRISPLSGAGWGNALLMARMLALPSFEWVEGERVERQTIGRSERFEFPRGSGKAAQVDLPDVELVREATGAPSVATFMALSPGFLLLGLRAIARVVAWSGPLRRPLLALLHWQLAFLRGLVLRDRTTSVEIVARVTGGGRTVEQSAEFDDGFEATAAGVVQAVDAAIGAETGWQIAGRHLAPAAHA